MPQGVGIQKFKDLLHSFTFIGRSLTLRTEEVEEILLYILHSLPFITSIWGRIPGLEACGKCLGNHGALQPVLIPTKFISKKLCLTSNYFLPKIVANFYLLGPHSFTYYYPFVLFIPHPTSFLPTFEEAINIEHLTGLFWHPFKKRWVSVASGTTPPSAYSAFPTRTSERTGGEENGRVLSSQPFIRK